MGIKVIMYIYNFMYMLSFLWTVNDILVYIFMFWSIYTLLGNKKAIYQPKQKRVYIFQDVIDGPHCTCSCDFIHTQTLLCTLCAPRKLVIFSSICKRKNRPCSDQSRFVVRKSKKRFLTSYWFVEQGTSEYSEWHKIDPG